jgi:predicted transcriptional regulator
MKLLRRIRRWLARVTDREGLYARVKGKQLLEHEARQQILDMLEREPGLCFQEVQDRVGLAPGTTKWHLRKLEDSDFITSLDDGRYTRFAPTGLDPSTLEAVLSVRDPSRLALVRMVQRNPGITQGDLATAAGLAQSTASHHLERLIEDGVVEKRKDGRANRYHVPDGMEEPVREAVRYVM